MTTDRLFAQSAEEMLAEARKTCGIEIIDEAALAPLTVIVDSYNKEANFNEDGARQMRNWIMRILVNRLRMKRDFLAHPEIADIPLKAPIIISCIPRTGSTKLQKVLSITDDFNSTPFWLTFNPSSITGVPHESVATRIADSDAFVAWLNQSSPDTKRGHDMATHEPEEDSFIMGHSLYSPWMSAFAVCPSYMEWFSKQDHSIQYFYDRDVLKYLIWQGLADVDKPFVLKSAYGSGNEAFFLRAFPDAHVVISHRHPRKSVPSSCRLSVVFRSAFSDKVPDMRARLPGQAGLKQREIDFRKAHPKQRFLDIGYRQIEAGSEPVVRQIYDFAGIPLSETAVNNIRKWEAANPKDKHGAHRYTCEDFGFTEAQVDELFAEYTRSYGEFLE